MASDVFRELSESRLKVVITAISATVCALVAFMVLFPGALALGRFDVSYAPKLHAFINGTCFVLLISAYVAIRSKRIQLHRALMLSTLLLSSVFLVSYVVYHSQQQEPVHIGAEGTVRLLYFGILISHIVLAAIILPLALWTIARSWRGEFAKHRRIAKITLPIWLYVTLSGVLVYLMLYVWYPSGVV